MRRTLNDPMRQLTLSHVFTDLQIPAALHELTPELLSQLYDQAVHYGFTDVPMDPTRILFLPVNGTLVKIAVLLSDDVLRINIGSKRTKPIFIISPNCLVVWRAEICVADIANAANELDKMMALRGYFDDQTEDRIDILDGGRYAIDEVFPQKYLYYILPSHITADPTQVFDKPENLCVLQLETDKVLCRKSEARLVQQAYKQLSLDDVAKAGKDLLQGIRSQMSPSRQN